MSRLDTLGSMLGQENPYSCTMPRDDDLEHLPKTILVIDEYCSKSDGDCYKTNCPIWFAPDVPEKLNLKE